MVYLEDKFVDNMNLLNFCHMCSTVLHIVIVDVAINFSGRNCLGPAPHHCHIVSGQKNAPPKATRFLSGASLLRQVLQHSSTWQCHVSPLPTASTLLPPPHLSGLKVTSGSELLLRHRWVGWRDVYSGPRQLQLHTFLSLDPPDGQCGSLGPAEQRLPVRQKKPLHHETHFRSFN